MRAGSPAGEGGRAIRAAGAAGLLAIALFCARAGAQSPKPAAAADVPRLAARLPSGGPAAAEALRALAAMGGRAAPAMPAIARLLGSREPCRTAAGTPSTLGREAAIALARFGNPAVEALRAATRPADGDAGGSPSGRRPAIHLDALDALRRIGGPDAAGLAAEFLSHPDPAVRTRAAAVPGAAGEKQLADPHPAVRRAALAAIRPASGPGGAALLERALKDSSWEVRETAVSILASLDDPGAGAAAAALLNDKAWQVRRAALRSAGALAYAPAAAAVEEAAKDENWLVRAEAARCLAALGERRAVGTLLLLSKDRDADVRREAVRAIGALGDREAVPFVAPLLKDRDPRVRADARRTLAALSGVSLPPDPEAWYRWWNSLPR